MRKSHVLCIAFAAALIAPPVWEACQRSATTQVLKELHYSNINIDGTVSKERCDKAPYRVHFFAKRGDEKLEGVACRSWTGQTFVNAYPKSPYSSNL